ncbi:uncharacterized protein LOC132750578 [Ruditapes philippinarum]|uniref:uncharacterized protein LOC132750578 n=1 Tax=Ruditapes philippinarum TaxID=129788 RepID=UPI00295BB726|nr:uncharacterized protein LOC132750578 [Ruditapes philippinarum]
MAQVPHKLVVEGNEKCWHGSLDILFGSINLFADVLTVETSDEDTTEEVKLDIINDRESRSRILAQLITFLFLQRKGNRDTMTSFLVPCIAITDEELKVFFYDSEHDLLLENREHKLFGEDGEINFEAILTLWLVMNYKVTCSGVPSTLVAAPKSNFIQHAEKLLGVYKNELQFTGVAKGNTFKSIDYRYLAKTNAKFVWPPEHDEP